MRIFVTGATGYIGGSIAARLVARGDTVWGLTRSPESRARLQARGIEPVLGSLHDDGVVAAAAQAADAVVNAADTTDPFVVATLVDALEGSGKKLLHASGSYVVSDRAAGHGSPFVYHEEFQPVPAVEREGQIAIDRFVQRSASKGIHSTVLCLSMIYGGGLGLRAESMQVPDLIALAKESGAGMYIGPGENRWSNVHIADAADAFVQALDHAPPGSFFFVENGEASLRSIAESISRMLGFGGATRSYPLEDAVRRWGADTAHFGLASNSRVSALKARRMLGWSPSHDSIHWEIEHGHYRARHGNAAGSISP